MFGSDDGDGVLPVRRGVIFALGGSLDGVGRVVVNDEGLMFFCIFKTDAVGRLHECELRRSIACE